MKKIKPAAVILAFVSILLGLIMLLPVVGLIRWLTH